jgi:hypothetical protein
MMRNETRKGKSSLTSVFRGTNLVTRGIDEMRGDEMRGSGRR